MTDLQSRIAGLALWHGEPKIEQLIGGLSNINFKVTDGVGKYVVRTGADFPFHHVFRDREAMTARAAYAVGLAPQVLHAEPGLMVFRFIDGKVFAADDVRKNLERIAELLKRFHEDMPARVTGPAFFFWPFHVVRDYANTLQQHSRNPLISRLPDLLQVNDAIEAKQAPLRIVFGHHDLLPANIIDDGKKLWLIDFEYAGFGTAMFDLAGLASNSAFDSHQSQALLEAYFGGPVPEEIRVSHAGMECASLLREALWSLVSEIYLKTPGVDYDAYARENLLRFDAALDRYRALTA